MVNSLPKDKILTFFTSATQKVMRGREKNFTRRKTVKTSKN